MDSTDREALRETILADLDELRGEIASLEALTRPVAPDDAIGRVSRLDAINNKSINDAALRAAHVRLDQLKRALSDLDKPHFGRCIRCGESIPLGRIKLMPHAKTCVRCATRS